MARFSALILAGWLVLLAAPAQAGFVHPGAYSSQEELELVRDRVNNEPDHPMVVLNKAYRKF